MQTNDTSANTAVNPPAENGAVDHKLVDNSSNNTSAKTVPTINSGSSGPIPPSGVSGNTSKKLFIGFFGALALILLVSIGVLAYTILSPKPEKILLDALTKSAEASSFEARFKTGDGNFVADSVYHKDKNMYSKLSVTIKNIENQKGSDLSAVGVFNDKKVYVQGSYTKLDETVAMVKSTMIPNVESLETYKLILPVLKNEKWLVINIPEASGTASVPPASSASDKQMEAVVKKFGEALVIHRFDKNYKKGYEVYTRISLGFDKKKLITAINSFKDTDLDVKVSQINAVVKYVEASDNWDSDLIDVLIDRDSYIREATIRAPEVSPKTLEELINEGSKDNQELSYLKGFTSQIEGVMKSKTGGKLTDIGTIEMDSYNKAVEVAVPTNVVTMEEVSSAFSKELLPILGLFMGGGGSSLPQNLPQTQKPVNNSVNTGYQQNAQYVYPTIEPGKPGSKEWEEEFWKNWNEMGAKNDEMQKQVEESQKKFCEENPNLCQ